MIVQTINFEILFVIIAGKKAGKIISKVCRLKNNIDKQNAPNYTKYNKLHEVKIENCRIDKCDYTINSVSKMSIPH